MKTLSFQTALFITSFFIFQLVFSKNQTTVSGIIFDSITGKSLPYVNICLYSKNMGTVSNNDGYFIFKFPEMFLNDTLIISHIGYRTYSKRLCEFSNIMNVIELEPEPIELSEVVIIPVTGLEIVKEAIQQLPDNNIQLPYLMTGFYRELIREKQDLHKYAEGVINIYREQGNKDLIKLIKGRKRENLKAFAVHKKADPTLGGPISCFYKDITNYDREFFTEDNFKFYDYSIERIAMFNNKPTYIVSFDKKPNAKKGLYRGKLYIDRDSKALVKAEYEYNEFGLKKSQPDPVQRSLARLFVGIIFESAGSSAEIDYVELEGQWYLKSIRYTIIDKLTRKNKVYLYTTEKDLVISKITTEKIVAFEENELLDPRKEFSIQIGEYDEAFWTDFNILKATDTQKSFINNMGIEESE